MGFHSERMGCITDDLWPFMKNVACPTLIVRGEESPFLSREDAQKMSVIIPNAEWVEISQATHMPVQENPTEFKRVISDFLKK
jgi:pimeloyl-ACP methyl ester carboxylesterase